MPDRRRLTLPTTEAVGAVYRPKVPIVRDLLGITPVSRIILGSTL